MIRVQASRGEVEISGQRADLKALSDHIQAFLGQPKQSMFVDAETGYDPKPYESALARIRFEKNAQPLHAQVKDGELHISARSDMLELLAKNLPHWAEHPESGISYHVHFDSSGWPGDITEESPELILLLRKE